MKFKLILPIIYTLTSISCNNIETNQTKQLNAMIEINKSAIETYFETFNQHNWDTLYNMYNGNALFKDPSLGVDPIHLTKDDFVNKYAELATMFPNLRDEIVSVYPSGENVIIVEFVAKGTSADGMELHLPICTIFTLENGKIVSDHTYYNNAE